MADLDDIQATLIEIRELVKTQMKQERESAERSAKYTETALARQSIAVRNQRLSMIVLVVVIGCLYFWISTKLGR